MEDAKQQHTPTKFLSALRDWTVSGTEIDLFADYQSLCQQFSRSSDLTEWRFFCRDLIESILSLLTPQDALRKHPQHERDRRVTQLSDFYEKCMRHHQHLPPALRVVWFTTLAESSAQNGRFHDAITQGCDALRLCEEKKVSKETFQKMYDWLDPWVQTQARHAQQSLLPRYLEDFYAALEPLERSMGQITAADLQKAIEKYLQLLPWILWLNVEAGRNAEKRFLEAMQLRQDEIVALAKASSGGVAKQRLQTLLMQWRGAGFHTAVNRWQTALRDEEMPLPEDKVLSVLGKSLSAFSAEPVIPQGCDEAHQSFIQILKQYALHGQREAFAQAKSRYMIRLQSYQLFYQQLSQSHAQYAPLALWCQSHLMECQKLTFAALASQHQSPMPWPWQTARISETPVTLKELQRLSEHLFKQLMWPSAHNFELLWMQSTTDPKKWCLHILIGQPTHADEVLKSYQQLFQLYAALLPASQIEIDISTPEQLSHRYTRQTAYDRAYVLVSHENFPPTQDALYTQFVQKIVEQLEQQVGRAKAQERSLRTQYHAHATAPLIEPGDASHANPEVMLQQRIAGHKAISELWEKLEKKYEPLVDMLACVANKYPGIVQSFLKEEKESDAKSAKPDGKDFYKFIPRLWKPYYLSRLNHHAVGALLVGARDDETSSLYLEADATGWCARSAVTKQKWEADFQRLLDVGASLVGARSDEKGQPQGIAPTTITCTYVTHGAVHKSYLHPDIAKQLINPKGQWLPKDGKTGGRHHTLRMVVPATKDQPEKIFWLKLEPEQPGTEWLVKKIDDCIGTGTIPSHQFCKLQIGDQPPVSALIIEDVQSVLPKKPPIYDKDIHRYNLAYVLKHNPELLKKISPLSFISNLVRVLTVQPEDDKPEDYYLLPDPEKPGYYVLVKYDHERSFFSPEQIAQKAKPELNVKSILLCLDQMKMPWADLIKEDPRLIPYREKMLKLVPAECFQEMLREGSDLHDLWCGLFSEKALLEIAQRGLKKGEMVLPTLMILPECERALLERLYLIQQAWQNPESMMTLTPLSTLSTVQPALHRHYQPLFESPSTPQERFNKGPGKLYQQDAKGGSRTTVSSMASLSRQLNLPAILSPKTSPKDQEALLSELLKKIWRREEHSAAQALEGVGIWQHEKVLMLEQNLWILEAETVTEAKTSKTHPATREEAKQLRHTAQLQFQLLPISERTNLIKRMGENLSAFENERVRMSKSIALLNALSRTAVTHLCLTPFSSALTEERLLSLLKSSGHQLLSLDISGCKLLTPKVISLITKYCPNLRTLKASHLPWTTATIENAPHLLRLDLSHSVLETLTLNGLQNLRHLSLNESKLIKSLGNVKKNISRVQPYNLPELDKLDIRNCCALEGIYIKLSNPGELSLKWGNIWPGILVEWMEFLSRDKTRDWVFFNKIKITVNSSEKKMDLSEYLAPFKQVNLNSLWILLKWNIPIKHLEAWRHTLITKEQNLQDLNNESLDEYYAVHVLLMGDKEASNMFINSIHNDNFCYVPGNTMIKSKRMLIDNKVFELRITDSPRYLTKFILSTNFESSDIVIWCLDPYDISSWEGLRELFSDPLLSKYILDAKNVLVAVKSKANKHLKYAVNILDVQKYAQENSFAYFECSVETGEGIKDLLEYAARIGNLRFSYMLENALLNVLQKNKTLVSLDTSFSISPKLQELLDRNKKLAIASPQEQKFLPYAQVLEVTDQGASKPKKEIFFQPKESKTEVQPSMISNKNELKQPYEEPLKSKIPHQSDKSPLAFLQPLAEADPKDTQSMLAALQHLSSEVTDDEHPWEHDLSHLHQQLREGKLDHAQQTLKQLCLSLQYQQRTASPPKPPTTLSPAQAFIQSHPELQQYHDLFLQTLEFSIKAAILGVTGRISMTNTTGAVLSVASGAADLVPVVGGALKLPVAALEIANKLKMRYEDGRVSQLFKGARDIEMQVEMLAEQMTLAIHHELLDGKRTPLRQKEHEKGGVQGFYEKNKSWLSQKARECFDWATFTPAQKQALADAHYLLENLPKLAAGPAYRDVAAGVPTFLKILMCDPSYEYNEKSLLPPSSPQHRAPHPSHQAEKHQHYEKKRDTCLAKLKAQTSQPFTVEQWPSMLLTVSELERNLTELEAQRPQDAKGVSNMLGDWFDRLQTQPSALQLSFASAEQSPTLSASSSSSSSPISSSFFVLPGRGGVASGESVAQLTS